MDGVDLYKIKFRCLIVFHMPNFNCCLRTFFWPE